MGRPRKAKNKGLEPHLYRRENGHFAYLRPDTKEWVRLGKDKKKAQSAARKANARLCPDVDLVAKIMGTHGKTVSDACQAFTIERITNNTRLAPTSKKEKSYRVNRIERDFSAQELENLSTADVAKWLDGFTGDAYQQHRSVLSQIIDFAQTKGWCTRNVVTPTLSSDPNKKKSRKRLTLDQFIAIHQLADPWFKATMMVSLLTCQGRNEMARMRYDDIKDNILYIVRQKTQNRSESAYIAIEISPALQQALEYSRQIPPMSPYIVHRRPERIIKASRQDEWSVKPGYLSREFQKLRDKIPEIARMPQEERPTFHEIRALGAHLIEKNGKYTDEAKASAQALLGHAEIEMTEHYLSGHEKKWTPAAAPDFDLSHLFKLD